MSSRNCVDAHMRGLRENFEPAADYLQTNRGLGRRLSED